MKYKDSIPQAKQQMVQAIQQLEAWCIPANPINYAISYHYVAGTHEKLSHDINAYLVAQNSLDEFFLEELFRQYILGQSQFRDDLITDLTNVLSDVQQQCVRSSTSVGHFIHHINENLSDLQSKNKAEITQAISSIYQAANVLKVKQEAVAKQLIETQAQTEQLKTELEEIRKDIFLDPLTGLYNRKALNNHMETWVTENPEQHIAAIVINVDHFKQLSNKFGPLIGNVLLAKVAKKVTSYVGESGLPVRTGTDEFLILLPDIEKNTAAEIAEKIREGVEKLRFISSKTGVRLPQLTISLGVNELKAKHNVQALLAKTRIVLKNFQRKQHNQVIMG